MIINILVFILVLGILVLAHELGHFVVARWCGIAVEEFGVGYPPRLWSKKRRGTIYSINALPLGGFVRLKGEFTESEDKAAFNLASVWARIAVVIAGVVMNILLAWAILAVAFMIGFTPFTKDLTTYPGAKVVSSDVLVASVLDNTPAATVGLQAGDLVRQIGDKKVVRAADISTYTAEHKQQDVVIVIDRSGETKQLTVKLNGPDSSPLGIALGEGVVVRLSFWQSIRAATNEVVGITSAIGKSLWGLVRDLFSTGQVKGDVSGPVGIYRVTAAAASAGPAAVVSLLVLFSINLAIINILPFPALDGGRFLFLVIEAVRGKRVISEKIESVITSIGFILLLLLIILLTYRDLFRVG